MVPAGPVLRCAEAVGECLAWGDGALRYTWHPVEGVCVALPDAVPVDRGPNFHAVVNWG